MHISWDILYVTRTDLGLCVIPVMICIDSNKMTSCFGVYPINLQSVQKWVSMFDLILDDDDKTLLKIVVIEIYRTDLCSCDPLDYFDSTSIYIENSNNVFCFPTAPSEKIISPNKVSCGILRVLWFRVYILRRIISSCFIIIELHLNLSFIRSRETNSICIVKATTCAICFKYSPGNVVAICLMADTV